MWRAWTQAFSFLPVSSLALGRLWVALPYLLGNKKWKKRSKTNETPMSRQEPRRGEPIRQSDGGLRMPCRFLTYKGEHVSERSLSGPALWHRRVPASPQF